MVNFGHFKTPIGWLKLVQLLCTLIAMICDSPPRTGYAQFFMFVAVVTFVCTALLVVSHLFQFGIPKVDPVCAEFTYTASAAVLWLLATILEFCQLSYKDGKGTHSYIVAAIIGLLATGAYGAGTYYLYKTRKSGTTLTGGSSVDY